MRRDFGNELIAAVAAVALVAFTVTFGILLSVSNTESYSAQSTATAAAQQLSETPTVEIGPVVSDTADVPTDAPTVTEEATTTDVPTVTEEATTTDVPTVTEEATTAVPTESPTSTSTETEIPTRTPVATATPVSDTPTETSFPTETPLSADTLEPSPELTEEVTPEVTEAVVVEDADCVKPDGWVTLLVESGFTLYGISRSVGSSVEELQTANCLDDAGKISIGQELFVPRLPTEAVETFVPSNGDGSVNGLAKEGCSSPAFVIIRPSSGQQISGPFDVFGTALMDNFSHYTLEVRANDSSSYQFVSRSDIPLFESVLGQINPAQYGKGIYWIKLTVFMVGGGVPHDGTCVVPVSFR